MTTQIQIRRFLVLGLMLAFAAPAFAQQQGSGQIKTDESAVNSACTAEAQAAGCGSEQAGHGLVKCIWAYKRQQKKNFTISPGCQAAMKQLGSATRAKKQGQ